MQRIRSNQSLLNPAGIWPMNRIRRAVLFASLLALGILLNTLEGMVLPRGWPVRLGLANLSLMCALMLLPGRDLPLLVFFRVIVTSLIFGSFFQLPMWLGLFGGLAGVLVMLASVPLLRTRHLSWLGVSLLAAAAHTSAQIGVFSLFFAPAVLKLYPAFLGLAVLSGLVTGLLMLKIEDRVSRLV